MAKYTKRKDGRYITSVTLGNKKYYIYGKTIKEIDRKIIELKVKYEQGLLLKSPNVLFKDYKMRWFKSKKPMIGAKSVASYQSIINNHLLGLIICKCQKSRKLMCNWLSTI